MSSNKPNYEYIAFCEYEYVGDYGWYHVNIVDNELFDDAPCVIFSCLKRGTERYVQELTEGLFPDKFLSGRYSLIITKWRWWHNFVR